ncbi:MAG TPA: cupredoxin domain-containing protein [Actinomycetota bacterium]|nr:cupredoxin domain-containing protein [Actinomycetota bacterium]
MENYRNKLRIQIVLSALVLAFAGFACDGNGGGDGDAVESPTPEDTVPRLGGDRLDRERVNIELVDNEYRPSEITVTGGDVVTFLLDNTGENGHTFTSPELDLDVELQFGQQSRVDIPLPDDGKFDFSCRFHGDRGMTGTITVE